MLRFLAISISVGSLFVLPTLCLAGVMSHACECECDTELGFPCETSCDHESSCRHESGCADDPCSIRVVRPERQDLDLSVCLPVAVCLMGAGAESSDPPVGVSRGSWLDGLRREYPFHFDSDLPLLI